MATAKKLLITLTLTSTMLQAAAQNYPQAKLTSGILRATVYLPDQEKGYYRGTRFDWSGVIGDLYYRGHTFFRPFYDKFDSSVPDVVIGDTIVAGANSAASGPVEEFIGADNTALGYSTAEPKQTFCKIGVGALKKPVENGYSSFQHYIIANAGRRSVKSGSDWIEFTQRVDCGRGYAYSYRKTLRLVKGKPVLLIEHTLDNTGQKPVDTEVYDHNFLSIDGQPSGPDFLITFPFDLRATESTAGLGEVRGRQFVFSKALAHADTLYTPLEGFGSTVKDYRIKVENRRIGAGVMISGDRPLSQLGLWAVRSVLAPEPYVHIVVLPSKTFSWTYTYEFYTIPSASAQ